MSISPQTAAYIAAGTIAAGLGITIFFAAQPANDPFAPCRDGMAAAGPKTIGGPFELVSETGETVSEAQVITGPTLMYFGYTFCPDVCPLDNTRNAEAIYLLDEKGYNIAPVFVSVDSARDTPALLAEFTNLMHPRMLGLTGSEAQVKKASQAYKTYFKVQSPGDPYTLLDHSTQTYFMLPDYGFVAAFDRDMEAPDMAEKLACYVDTGRAAGLIR